MNLYALNFLFMHGLKTSSTTIKMARENEQEGNDGPLVVPPHADLFEDNQNNYVAAGDSDNEADDDGSSTEEDNNVVEHHHHLETMETLIDDLQRVKNNNP